MPDLSVITACFNSGESIGECIRSRQENLGSSVVHIIQDGASKDNTLSVIEQLGDAAMDIVSAPDGGLYDALNKAVARVSSRWLMFLHSDDRLVYSNLLQDIAEAEQQGARAISYGVRFRRHSGRVFRIWHVRRYRRSAFRRGFMLPHTGLVVRRELFEQYGGFRLDLGSAADYEWMLRVFYKGNEVPLLMPGRILTEMHAGGMSDAGVSPRLKANENDKKAWLVNGLRPGPLFRVLKPLRKVLQFLVFRQGKPRGSE